MSKKIIEGLWDCPFCDADKIGGLQKHCPNCGHPQSKDTMFYMGTKKRYLADEEISTVGTEPDWACDYCSSLNNAKFIYCTNCGGERTKETKDYFDLHTTQETKEESLFENTYAYENDYSSETENELYEETENTLSLTLNEIEDMDTENKSNNFSVILNKINFLMVGKCIGAFALVFLLIAGLIYFFTPREYDAIITEKTWERDVVIEEYRTVEESAWDNVPSGGRLLYSSEEIRSYNTVLSHYETKTRQVAEQVFDGYDTHTYYTDNGNGTFTEHTSQTPRYRTEYRTETYQDPVYVNVPVYDTKYYYEIERWVYDRTEESSGSNSTPFWPEYEITENERPVSKIESYVLVFYVPDKEKTYSYDCSDMDEWDSYQANESKTIVLNGGRIVEIK